MWGPLHNMFSFSCQFPIYYLSSLVSSNNFTQTCMQTSAATNLPAGYSGDRPASASLRSKSLIAYCLCIWNFENNFYTSETKIWCFFPEPPSQLTSSELPHKVQAWFWGLGSSMNPFDMFLALFCSFWRLQESSAFEQIVVTVKTRDQSLSDVGSCIQMNEISL